MATTDLLPMEAKLISDLPDDGTWQFEPKWDGFRALVFRRGDDVEITSKSGKSLSRYCPEVVHLIRQIHCREFMLDGELILPIGDVLSFDTLQARLHPAASHVVALTSWSVIVAPFAVRSAWSWNASPSWTAGM
jgi:ATP-dependent DNA ligase